MISLEGWNNGMMEEWVQTNEASFGAVVCGPCQHSNIPSFQYSGLPALYAASL
jgi:hypothetical protein